MEHQPVRVFLRPIGSPLTIGMAGLAIASLVQSGLELGWISPTEGKHVGMILIAVPFVMQLVACLLAFLARDGAAGTALGIQATGWLGLGLVLLTSPPEATSGALGLLLLSAGGMLALSSVAVGAAKPLIALVFLAAAARFGLAGVHELSDASVWKHIAGVLGLVITGLAAYCVIAFELESQLHRPLVPTWRRGPGRTAIGAGLDGQAAGVANEAGVRQVT